MRIKTFISAFLAVAIFFTSTEAIMASEPDVEALNSDEFGMAVSECVKEESSEPESDGEGQRVIGQTKGVVDFSSYDAEEAIVAEDGRFLLSFDSVEDAEKCIDELCENESVLYAEPDASVEICTDYETQSGTNLSWGSGAIQTDKLADSLKGVNFGRTVTVAIVDSGAAKIDYLKGHMTEGYDFVDNDSDPSNDTSKHSHGTFLSSIVVDNTKNLPIEIMPVRVLTTSSGSISNVVNGIHYAVDHGADVINLSLGGKFSSCSSVDAAVEYAISKNVAVVVSAGNYCENTMYYCPAHVESAITVSAVDSEMKFASKYSNYGSEVDFAAPGTGIIGYNASGVKTSLDGTSMSAAFISACVGILKLLYPAATVDSLQSALADSAINPISVNKNKYYGFGIPQMMYFSKYQSGGIILVPGEKNLVPGETFNFSSYNLSDLSLVKGAEWTSSNSEVVKIDSNGVATALKSGTAEIVCKSNGSTSKCIVNVKKIESISVSELPKTNVYVYKLEQFDPSGIELTVTYSDGTTDNVSYCPEMTFEGFDSQKPGTQKMKVTYYDAETEFEVGVGFLWWQLLIRVLLFGWIWY